MMVTSQLYNTTELAEVIGSGGIDNILKDLYILIKVSLNTKEKDILMR